MVPQAVKADYSQFENVNLKGDFDQVKQKATIAEVIKSVVKNKDLKIRVQNKLNNADLKIDHKKSKQDATLQNKQANFDYKYDEILPLKAITGSFETKKEN